LNRSTNIRHLINDQLYNLIRYAEEDNLQGSDWIISHINYMTVLIINNPLIRAGSYIDTPKRIEDKHAIINIQNDGDNECLKWSILAALYPAKYNQFRSSNYNKLIIN